MLLHGHTCVRDAARYAGPLLHLCASTNGAHPLKIRCVAHEDGGILLIKVGAAALAAEHSPELPQQSQRSLRAARALEACIHELLRAHQYK